MADRVRDMIRTGDWQLEELSIEVSNRCLGRCIHCSSGAQPKALPDELSMEEHFRIMHEARELGATVLSLSGGDPILHPHLLKLVDQAFMEGYEQILLYTTGIWDADLSFVDGEVSSPTNRMKEFTQHEWQRDAFGLAGIETYPYLYKLLDYKDTLTFIFSLHSHVASVNDYIMNLPGAHRVIVSGIRYLTGTGARVWTHFVPMQPNYKHISATRDLCVNVGVEKMSLLRFVPQTRGRANQAQLLPGIEMMDAIQHIIDYELEHPDRKDLPTAIRAGCPADFRHASEGTSVYNDGTGKPKSCHAGTDLILVRPNGTVHPCAAWKSLPTDSNVRDKSLAEIWEGDETYAAIRRYLQEGYRELGGECAKCVDFETCRGGCPAQRLHAFGRRIGDLYYPESDPLCPTRLRRD